MGGDFTVIDRYFAPIIYPKMKNGRGQIIPKYSIRTYFRRWLDEHIHLFPQHPFLCKETEEGDLYWFQGVTLLLSLWVDSYRCSRSSLDRGLFAKTIGNFILKTLSPETGSVRNTIELKTLLPIEKMGLIFPARRKEILNKDNFNLIGRGQKVFIIGEKSLIYSSYFLSIFRGLV